MKSLHLIASIAVFIFASVSASAALTRVSTSANGTTRGCESHSSYPPAQAFDGAAPAQAGRWLVEKNKLPAWIEYRFNNNFGATVSQYKIISGGDPEWDKKNLNRFPPAWTLSGSDDDGATWIEIDSQAAQTWTSAGETKTFALPQAASFRAYRFDIPDNGGNPDYLSLSELELWGEEIEWPPPAPLVPVSNALLEAESFRSLGGWKLDTMFVPIMGSVYLNAHGAGIPVEDATTRIAFEPGEYAVWARTRDWTPDYNGADKPGRFQILIDGEPLATTFGTAPADWGWTGGGTFTATGGVTTVALRDLTGFNGRCDAVYFTQNLQEPAPPDGGAALDFWRAEKRGESGAPETVEEYDFVVVGGGIAGCAAAVAAAQEGLRVALIQERDVLGGNTSGEIRIQTTGNTRGNAIVEAIQNNYVNGNSGAHSRDSARMAYVSSHANITLRTGWRAYWASTNEAALITSVDARDVRSGERRRFAAPLFADCTGDGWVGYWAGADFRMGREAKSEFGETQATLAGAGGRTLIPDVADNLCLGNSLLWASSTRSEDTAFPDVEWARMVSGNRADTSGGWTWETGLNPNEDTIYDAEMLRDRLLRAIFGNFKNAHNANPKLHLSWVPYVTGKRESRRLMGDHIITQHDVQNGAWFEDAIGTASWPIDLHFYENESVPYIAKCSQTTVKEWHFPYRALYSRNIGNLFMAGRDISCTHVAFGSLRVMNTCGQMGVAVGYAAALCKKYSCPPRDIYRHAARTQELQLMAGGAWPQRALVIPPEFDAANCVVVDNSEAALSGTWKSSDSEAGKFYGADYLHNSQIASPDLWVRYDLPIHSNGLYFVQAIWNSKDGASIDRAPAAQIEVVHADGATTNKFDMNFGAGEWNHIGKFRFDGALPQSVRILTIGCAGKTVIADAVRFAPAFEEEQFRDPLDYDANGLPDEWERLHFLQNDGVDPDGDPDNDGLSNYAEYISGTDPTDPASFFSIKKMFLRQAEQQQEITLRWNSAPDRAYTILWTDSLTNSFQIHSTIDAAPNTNETSATILPAGPAGFYKIEVKKNAPENGSAQTEND